MTEAEAKNILKKTKESLEFQWEAHCQAFGPILEPAFLENQQVRIPLIAALNQISRRKVKRGLEILQSLKPYCIYDEDKAAWTFFVGLCFEMAEKKEEMLQWYEAAGRYGHRFYLPYLKIAKAAHEATQLEKALESYKLGISCLLETEEAEQDADILGSAYTNLTSCLMLLHRYREAQQTWKLAQQYPQPPGADAIGAALSAVAGGCL